MALTCLTAFDDNTFGETAATVSCFPNRDGLAPFEVIDERDLLLILDSLIRIQAGEGSGEFPDIADADPCDVQQAAYLAQCKTYERALQTEDVTPAKLKALIFWMLNEALCA